MAISRGDFCSFIIELAARNPNLGIPALEDGLFGNLLILNYLYGKGKGKGKGKREVKKGREKEGKLLLVPRLAALLCLITG